jgi:hypothetical protein
MRKSMAKKVKMKVKMKRKRNRNSKTNHLVTSSPKNKKMQFCTPTTSS